MDTLTRRQLTALAPGARRRWNTERDKLLCTQTDFLDPIEPAGYLPVFALQGSTHEDSSYDPEEGRHLVVAARPDGTCMTLLNSHCKLLRVWVGAGLWDGADNVLIQQVMPVQRWLGCGDQLRGLEICRGGLCADHDILKVASGTPERQRAATTAVLYGGYPGRSIPSRKALLEAAAPPGELRADMLTFAFGLVRAARAGNLHRNSLGGPRRNIKGIRRPDALQMFSLAAFRACLRACK